MTDIAEAFVNLQFVENLQRQLELLSRRIGDFTVKVDGDTSKLRDAIRAFSASVGDITIKIDGDTTGLRRAVRDVETLLPNVKIKVELDDSSVAGVRAKAQILHRYLIALFNRIPIKFEISDLSGLMAQLALLQALIGSIGAGGGGGGGGGGPAGILGQSGNWQQLLGQLALFLGLIPAIIAGVSLLTAVIVDLIGSIISLTPALLLVFPAAFGFIGILGTLALGLDGVGKAFTDLASGNTKKFEADLKKLSPAAREFVLAVKSISPELKALQQTAQEAIFSGLAKPLLQVAREFLPEVKTGVQAFGGVINIAAKELLHVLTIPSFKSDFALSVQRVADALKPLAYNAGNVIGIFQRLTEIASGPLGRVTTALGQGIQDLAKDLSNLQNRSSLTAFLNIAIDRLGELWSIIKSVWQIFTGFLSAADQAQVSFKPLVDLFKDWADAINSPGGQNALRDMFKNAQDAFQKLEPFLAKLGEVAGKLIIFLVAMAPTFADALNNLTPLLDGFSQFLTFLTPFAGPIAGAVIAALIGFAVIFGVLGLAIAIPIVAIGALIAIVVGSFIAMVNGVIFVVQHWGDIMNWLGGVFGAIGKWIGEAAVNVGNAVAGAWNWAVNQTVTAWSNIVNFIKGVVTNVVNTVSGWQTSIRTIVANAWNAAYNAVASAVGRIIGFVLGIPNKIKAALGNLGGLLTGAGKSVIDGLYNGIAGGIDRVKGLLNSVTNAIPSWKGPMDVDMKLLTPSGIAVIDSLMRGIELQVPALRNQLAGITSTIPLNVGILSGAPGAGGTLNLAAPPSNDRDIIDLLKQLLAATKGVGPDVGKTIAGQGRSIVQSSRGA